MARRNPARAFRPVDFLPESAGEGVGVFLSPVGEAFVFDGGRWVGVVGDTLVVPAGPGVVARRAVTLDGGIAYLTDTTIHREVDGVTVAVVVIGTDDWAIVRRRGEVEGFGALGAGPLFVGTAPGTIYPPPLAPGRNVVRVGHSLGGDVLQVRPEQTILIP